jgi:hypothetical protein
LFTVVVPFKYGTVIVPLDNGTVVVPLNVETLLSFWNGNCSTKCYL